MYTWCHWIPRGTAVLFVQCITKRAILEERRRPTEKKQMFTEDKERLFFFTICGVNT